MEKNMTPQARKALEYINNAGGNATWDSFNEDHEPIGAALWRELRYPDTLIRHDPTPGRYGYIVLTDAGLAALVTVNEPASSSRAAG